MGGTTAQFKYGMEPADAIANLNKLRDDFNSAIQAGSDAGVAAGQAAQSAVDANGSKIAAGSSAAAAAGAATTATQQATASLANANNAAASNAAGQGYAGSAASAQIQALLARDAAITASQVATAANEMLAAQLQNIHYGNVVNACIGDVGKDSDPNWIKRMLHTSWYSEAICTGKWLGQQTNVLAASGDNGIRYPEEFDNAAWIKRGTCVVTANQVVAPDGTTSMDGISGLGASGGSDLYQTLTAALWSAGTRIEPSVYIQKISGAGTLVIQHPAAVSNGKWYIDLSKLGAGTERITRNHIAVTVNTEFTSTGLSTDGLQFYASAGTLSLYMWGAKLNKVGQTADTYSGSQELVQDGSFAAGTAFWTASPAWTIANGVATKTAATSANLQQNTSAIVAGKTYAVTFTAQNMGATSIRINVVNPADNFQTNYITGNGTQTVVFTASVSGKLTIFCFDNNVTVTGISCKEVTVFTTAYASCAQMAGSYYQSMADGKFYTLGNTYGAIVEVFRGNKRDFPALFAAILESSRLVIYDLTVAGCPMWAVFNLTGTANFWGSGSTATCVAYVNGKLIVGGGSGLRIADFARDSMQAISTISTNSPVAGIALRNAAAVWGGASTINIINGNVNGLAAMTAADAPVDAVTGLQLPTIGVATAGTPNGVTIIKNDGTASSPPNTYASNNISFDLQGNAVIIGENSRNLRKITASSGYTTVITNSGLFGFQGTFNVTGKGIVFQSKGLTACTRFTPGTTSIDGYYIIKENFNSLGLSMFAAISNKFNTGWMVGDNRFSALAETVVEALVGSGELIGNGTFSVDNSGWTPGGGGTAVVGGGVLTLTNGNGGTNEYQSYPVATVPGKTYVVTSDNTGSATFLGAGTTAVALTTLGAAFLTASGRAAFQFVATAATTYIGVGINSTANGLSGTFDNVSCKLAVADRSAKAVGMAIIGNVNKTAVATGAQLVWFNGFFGANYLEQPRTGQLEFGNGAWAFEFWASSTRPSGDECWFEYNNVGAIAGGWFNVRVLTSTGQLKMYMGDAANSVAITSSGDVCDGRPHRYTVGYDGTNLRMFRDGIELAAAVGRGAVGTLANATATLRVGQFHDGTSGATKLNIALLRAGATWPTVDQMLQAANDEAAMFQAGSQVTLDGTDGNVIGYSYEELTDITHVETLWGRTGMHGLVRVDSGVSQVGTGQGVVAGSGVHITFGSTGARFSQPSMLIREELRRIRDARRAAAKEVVVFDYDGAANQTDFVVPTGFAVRELFVSGSKKRPGATKDYTVMNDGYRETVRFGTSPGATWVSINANRSVA